LSLCYSRIPAANPPCPLTAGPLTRKPAAPSPQGMDSLAMGDAPRAGPGPAEDLKRGIEICDTTGVLEGALASQPDAGLACGGPCEARPGVGEPACESVRRSPGSSSGLSSDGSFAPVMGLSLAPAYQSASTPTAAPVGSGILRAIDAAAIASAAERGAAAPRSAFTALPPSPSFSLPTQDPSLVGQASSAAFQGPLIPAAIELPGALEAASLGARSAEGRMDPAGGVWREQPTLLPQKRKADPDMALDATELLVAQILSSGWNRDEEPPAKSPQPIARGKSQSGSKRASNHPSVSPVSGSPRSMSSADTLDGCDYTPAAKGRGTHGAQGAARGPARRPAAPSGPATAAPEWAQAIVEFLQENGQDLLHAICSHYRIDYNGELQSIRDYSMEQVAHNALFNPALPKAAGRLPMMLRDMPGVSDFKMTFLRDSGKIYRSVRVTASLKGTNVVATCRACSYCGSCFSGRFMKPNAMHQQAGGWKEITDKTAAGKYSWESLMGHRLCVPCFTHFAANGTNVNANRPSIEDLIQSEGYDLSEEYTSPSPTAGRSSTPRGGKVESRAKPVSARQQQLQERVENTREASEPARAWQKTGSSTRVKGKGASYDSFAEAARSQPNCMMA